MPLLQTFCTWFSIRMGSVIVAFISLAHSVVFIILIIISIEFQEGISSTLKQILAQYDFLLAKSWVTYFQENFIFVVTLALIFTLIYICGSLLLIHASYKLKSWYIWPFIIFDFIRLLLLTIIFVIGIIIIRKNVLDFNIVIVCLTVGGFYLLFQYYLWLCPISLWQGIRGVKKNKLNQAKKMDINQLIFNNYQSDFQFKPVLPNRNYFLYQYGNLPQLN